MSGIIDCGDTDVVVDAREAHYTGPAVLNVTHNGVNGLAELWIDAPTGPSSPNPSAALVNVRITPEEVISLMISLQRALRAAFPVDGEGGE